MPVTRGITNNNQPKKHQPHIATTIQPAKKDNYFDNLLSMEYLLPFYPKKR